MLIPVAYAQSSAGSPARATPDYPSIPLPIGLGILVLIIGLWYAWRRYRK